ncbi:hypothetical protein [Dyella sp. 333MFSha]|uniref:hypothetical protein n=1 Tax=Dyella sp. 333MFSha TaxID=1798240 RepID=UPI000B890365|nr:hypothetical protein [Dyella sp. 333MFSha]
MSIVKHGIVDRQHGSVRAAMLRSFLIGQWARLTDNAMSVGVATQDSMSHAAATLAAYMRERRTRPPNPVVGRGL